jgi:hypothetical protein
MWCLHQNGEWLLAFDREDGADTQQRSEHNSRPDDLEWTRWAVGDVTALHFKPVMPDRPVIVRPEMPVSILPGNEANYYVAIPVWMKITRDDSDTGWLCSEPTVALSNSWFGTPTSGSLCYSMRTTARRNLERPLRRPNRAVCPVKICNKSDEPLDFQRLCVHVEFLKIFNGESHLWTNPVSVTYRGEERGSRLDYEENAPEAAGVGELLSDSYEPIPRGLIRKSFNGLRSFIYGEILSDSEQSYA